MESTNPEKDGWKHGHCPDCLTEIERREMRDENNLSRYELEEIARDEAADSRMRDDKAFRDEP